jgi:hypothetical protein
MVSPTIIFTVTVYVHLSFFRGPGRHFPWHCRGVELPLLLHAKLELLKRNLDVIGCRSGAIPKDGMENREKIDI